MIHSKAMVIDETTAIIWSGNLTYGSFDLLHETNAVFRWDNSIVHEIIKQIIQDLTYSKKITLETIPSYNKWLAWIQMLLI